MVCVGDEKFSNIRKFIKRQIECLCLEKDEGGVWTWRTELKELQIGLPSFNSWNNVVINNVFYEYMEDKTGMSNT